ncbi:DUF1768-domain-containing protein [Violaceomyces palustris]|uniref:DUF1768-domain-containing protein n=1 Tax=Violaceomyces palustris TaxID=1673888 RepID=A0ACD0NSE5_9BASI|nr:DUF1768-domain-containing protein [Violaceomyces palustris]
MPVAEETQVSPKITILPSNASKMKTPAKLLKPSTWGKKAGSHNTTNSTSRTASPRNSKDLLPNSAPSAADTEVQAEPSTSPAATPAGRSRSVDMSAIPDEEGRIQFYHRGQPNFWLSNCSDHSIYSDNTKYPTAEHLFQASKFLPHKPEIAAKIRKTSNPLDAIKVARKYSKEVKAGWIREGINVQTMRDVLLLKFTQHSDIRRALLETDESVIVEASPTDAFWGSAGSSGRGRNELGKALMFVREVIRGASGLGWGSGAVTV